MLAAAKPEGAVAALVESGLIRAGLPAGDVTRYDVLTAFSRPATLVAVTLTGEHIRDLLEHGLHHPGGKSTSTRLLQVAGLRYGYDPDKAAGSRVTDVQSDANGWFADIQPEVAYRVAIAKATWRGTATASTSARTGAISRIPASPCPISRPRTSRPRPADSRAG